MLVSRRGSGAQLYVWSLVLSALLVGTARAQGNGSPDPPTNLSVTSVSTASATLTWQSVPSAATYEIEVATDSKFHSVVSSGSTPSTSYDASGLAGATTFLWRVRSDDGKKVSDWQDGASFTTDPPQVVARPPAAPSLVSPSNNAKDVPTDVTLLWSSVAGADSYRIQISTERDFAGTVADAAGITVTSFDATGLTPGTKMYWRVSATNAGGTSPWSSTRALTVASIQVSGSGSNSPASVDPPTGLQVDNVTSTSSDLSWTGPPGAKYEVQLSPADYSYDGSSSSVTASGLKPNTSYSWQVRSSKGNDVSAWVSGPSFSTLETPPEPPPSPSKPSTPTGLSATPTATDVALSWSGSAGATSYSVQVSTKSNFPPGQTDESATTETTLVIGGLNSQTTYFWRVSATNSAGTSGWSTGGFTTLAAQGSQKPSAPTGLSATPTATDVTLSWDGSAGATSYQVEISTKSNFPPGQTDQNTTAETTIAVAGLSSQTAYYWRVSATNAAGTSGWSTGGFTTLAVQGSQKPSAPTGLSATPTATDVALSWSGSAGATSYQVEISTKSNFPPGQTDQSVTAETTLAISGLNSQTTYYWRVSATNAAGTSGWSTGGFTTLTTQVSQKPSAPAGLNVRLTVTGATLTWNGSAGATSYQVQVSTKSNFPPGQTDQDVTTTDTTMTVGGLNSHTTYYWRVSAVNAAGASGWSVGVFTTTAVVQPSNAPSAPTGLSATPTATGATLTWNTSAGATGYPVHVSAKSNFPPGQTLSVTTSDTFFTVGDLRQGDTYYWQVGASDGVNSPSWSGVESFTVTASGLTAVDPIGESIPAAFRLSQNYPNPFNPSTTIEFSVPKSGPVKLAIYNSLGVLVHTLVDENLSPGTYRRQWVASGLASGVYYYRIQTNEYTETKRLVLLK
jgi:phosphodiesterase/alkaline phosphatase D-like protein